MSDLEKINIEAKVLQVLVGQVKIEGVEVTLDSSLVDDLGLDSLGAVEMLFDLETEYDIVISNEEAMGFKTPKDIIGFLETKLQAAKPDPT